MTFSEGYHWLDLGPISIELSTLAGFWVSLGIHLSISPLYVDFHVGWWCLSIMSRRRGVEIRGYEEAYLEG